MSVDPSSASSVRIAADELAAMAVHADLGLPVPRTTRFALLKRVVARVTWFTNREQVQFNHAVLATLRELRDKIEQAHAAVASAQRSLGDELAAMHTETADAARTRIAGEDRLRALERDLGSLRDDVARLDRHPVTPRDDEPSGR